MKTILIADGGSTKCDWAFLQNQTTVKVTTKGLNPFFMTVEAIVQELQQYLLPSLSSTTIDEIYFFGAAMGYAPNKKIIKFALLQCFPKAKIKIATDLQGAAVATCGNQKGVISILGTGSSIAYFNGKTIQEERLGLGYILGDEGSGTAIGKKLIQYYLYDIFDHDLREKFEQNFNVNRTSILENVYKKALPNRYLASFTPFIAMNRGHYMIENIIEDTLNDFLNLHIFKIAAAWKYPIHFVGGVAFACKDKIEEILHFNNLELGKVLHKPLEGLIANYHCFCQ